MLEYDFNDDFNNQEFENLGCDIVEIKERIILERHNKIKDLGIDGRYENNKELTIVQCKHYKDIKKLIDELKNVELAKVKKINPNRYILVLSINPTIKQKEKIKEIFGDYIKTSQDIITAEDLNSLLRKAEYQYIKKHFDDLILSKNINIRKLLEKIANPFIAQNSNFLLNDIEDIKHYFIPTKIFLKSYELLKQNHIIFLSGDAGSGKTTNAKMLLNNLLHDDLIDVVYKINSCDELITILDSKQRQGILFDDFWGSTFEHLKLELNEEKKLQEILDKIEKFDNIYLILTTREYVLNQGKSYYKDFNNKHIETRIIQKNCKYSDSEKVQILFSHAKKSHLDSKYLNIISYHAKEIISKANYSPRTVSFFISKNEDVKIDTYEFLEEFENFLRMPSAYLQSIFYKLSEGAQVLAFILSISNPEILIIQLQRSFQATAKYISTIKPSMYEDYLKELLDFFVEINKYRSKIIDFTNHSIHDFISNEFLKKFIDYEDEFCKGVIYFNQIYNLLKNKKYKLSQENCEFLISKLINNFDSLIITQDLDEFLDAEESEKTNPFNYKSHKIWKTFHILEDYKNEKLKQFLAQEINKLLDFYSKHYHHYECRNFINIPELIKRGTELGIEFNNEEVIKKYINNCNYFYELYDTKYFPKNYQPKINKYMKILGQNLKEKVETWILNDLYYMCEDGISIEYELTIEYIPKILKKLGLKPTPKIAQIIKENEPKKSSNYKTTVNLNAAKRKNTSLDKAIKNYSKQLYKKEHLTIKKLKDIIENANLSKENKEKIKRSIKNDDNIWLLIKDSSLEYANLILNFYEEKEKRNEKIVISRMIYPELLQYIQNTANLLDITFLKEYAYEIIANNFEQLSEKHFIDKYQISKDNINALKEIGVLNNINNIINFTDSLFTIYLAIIYLKEYANTTDLEKFINRDGIRNCLEGTLLEEFNTYNLHHFIMKPIFENIIQKGPKEWIKYYLDIDFNLKEDSIMANGELWILDELLIILINASLINNIKIVFQDFNDKEKTLNIKEFYFKKEKDETWHKLNNMLNDFFMIIEKADQLLKKDENKILNIEI